MVGLKASGVKGINLKEDYLIFGSTILEEYEYLNIYTNFKTGKRIKISELNILSRAKKGSMLFKKVKTKDYKIVNAYFTTSRDIILCKMGLDIKEFKNSDIPIMDIVSTGSQLTKKDVDLWALKAIDIYLIKKDEIKDVEENNEEKKETKQLSFDSFVEDFKI